MKNLVIIIILTCTSCNDVKVEKIKIFDNGNTYYLTEGYGKYHTFTTKQNNTKILTPVEFRFTILNNTIKELTKAYYDSDFDKIQGNKVSFVSTNKKDNLNHSLTTVKIEFENESSKEISYIGSTKFAPDSVKLFIEKARGVTLKIQDSLRIKGVYW